MDPFIEGQVWEDFHTDVITGIRGALIPSVRPRDVVRVQRRVYLEHAPEGPADFINPDVMVLERREATPPTAGAGGTATLVAVTPVVRSVPMPERRREAYLTVRERESMEVITVIEVLSPSNKR